MFLRPLVFSALLLVSSTLQAASDTVLVMIEEQGCIWCARWNEEISHIYPKTPEGIAAPLQRIDINQTAQNEISFARSLHFTPTFVLVVDGNEVSRLEGYPGEDFFWGLLGQILANANVEVTG